MTEQFRYTVKGDLPGSQILELYQANEWSSAKKPEQLLKALANSHSLIMAWDGDKLVGLGSAISDGHLVVYFPHLLVHPDYHKKGVGRGIMERLKKRYQGFHQQMLVSDGDALGFYERCGFKRAGKTISMWIYEGKDH